MNNECLKDGRIIQNYRHIAHYFILNVSNLSGDYNDLSRLTGCIVNKTKRLDKVILKKI